MRVPVGGVDREFTVTTFGVSLYKPIYFVYEGNAVLKRNIVNRGVEQCRIYRTILVKWVRIIVDDASRRIVVFWDCPARGSVEFPS